MYKVLIVEDEMLVRHGLKNLIDWNKHDMYVAGDVSNGKAAMDFYNDIKPDIIITDIRMPLMDGMELISRIRDLDGKTRIIILSCLEEFDIVKKAMSLGVSDYILKLTMTEEEIDKILEKIRNEINEQKKTMYFAAISALEAKYFYGSGTFNNYCQSNIYSIVEEKFGLLISFYSLFGIEDACFKNEYEKKVRSIIEKRLVQENQIKGILHQFLHWITDKMHPSDDKIYELAVACGESLQNTETMDETVRCIKDFIVKITDLNKERIAVSPEITKAIEYIKQNYVRGISLQDVARHVNLSASYFSCLFKKELQENFIDYLNEMRIEKAKELLRDTSLKTYEIAEKVGIKESTYFSLIFKKATGSSPNNFRRVRPNAWIEKNYNGDV